VKPIAYGLLAMVMVATAWGNSRKKA